MLKRYQDQPSDPSGGAQARFTSNEWEKFLQMQAIYKKISGPISLNESYAPIAADKRRIDDLFNDLFNSSSINPINQFEMIGEVAYMLSDGMREQYIEKFLEQFTSLSFNKIRTQLFERLTSKSELFSGPNSLYELLKQLKSQKFPKRDLFRLILLSAHHNSQPSLEEILELTDSTEGVELASTLINQKVAFKVSALKSSVAKDFVLTSIITEFYADSDGPLAEKFANSIQFTDPNFDPTISFESIALFYAIHTASTFPEHKFSREKRDQLCGSVVRKFSKNTYAENIAVLNEPAFRKLSDIVYSYCLLADQLAYADKLLSMFRYHEPKLETEDLSSEASLIASAIRKANGSSVFHADASGNRLYYEGKIREIILHEAYKGADIAKYEKFIEQTEDPSFAEKVLETFFKSNSPAKKLLTIDDIEEIAQMHHLATFPDHWLHHTMYELKKNDREVFDMHVRQIPPTLKLYRRGFSKYPFQGKLDGLKKLKQGH